MNNISLWLSKTCAFTAIASLLVGSGLVSSAQADQIEQQLSHRHFVASQESLSKLAGGDDALVARLLELRHSETPFVAVRAEKVLLSYADREDVQVAIESDLQSAQMRGLAQVIAVHIDSVPSPEARMRIAQAALARAERDQSYRVYAKVLIDCSDEQVRKLARSTLE